MLTPETILNAQKAQLDTLFQFAHKTFDNMEKLVQLNMAASRAALQDAANHSHQLLGVKDAPQLMAVQTQWFQPLAEKATAYSRSVYEIANGTSTEFVQSVEARTTELQKHLSELIDNTAKNAPVGTEAAVAVMKNAVAAATTAVESVQKAVKQASDMAQSNMQTVSKNVADAVKSSSQKA